MSSSVAGRPVAAARASAPKVIVAAATALNAASAFSALRRKFPG
jgi:hypothetical protein